ncbi:ion transporter [Salisediminibacterium selenitireducens]|uniref:Ion transport protein n=1 Tax=Bacillus selenitireducens (strain ATCC 700615 / DSM 15326 / MLS10) TaxID=439292 RepID=D6XVJ1_BACIE|nr:ion transporter [Salisediminibacterium selenitireducens]ADH99729.1 Ion transport protein [[Bacillus] selenitireducens MLS10]
MEQLRLRIHHIVEHNWFQGIIITLILFNAVIVGLETYPGIYAEYRSFFWSADTALLWIFTVEIAMRLFAAKPFSSFFKSSWNWFDFLIVSAGHIFVGAHFVTVLRILRVLRVFRAISVIPSLRRLVDALLMTIPSLGNIMLLMGIIFYIFAVIGTMLFQTVAPEYFGNLQLSLLTLFQVVTLESWASDVMRPIFDELWWSWIYFVLFVLVGTFVIFNLFIGVIVSNVEKSETSEKEAATAIRDEAQTEEIRALRGEIEELKALIKQDRQEK